MNGSPINPAARDYPSEFIQTGISAIDGPEHAGARPEAAGVLGQRPAARAAGGADSGVRRECWAATRATSRWCSAPIGITFEEADFFISDFRRTGAIDRAVLFMNLANDPAIERIATPRMALTAAEYLAYEKDMHVLVILDRHNQLCRGAARGVGGAQGGAGAGAATRAICTPTWRRCTSAPGALRGKKGSVTQIPILTMPEDDKTHPDTRPDRLHNRGPDNTVARAVPGAA